MNDRRNIEMARGNKSLVKVISDLLEREFRISIPLDQTSPYDLIAEKKGKVVKIQIKTTQIRDGAVRFKAHRWSSAIKDKGRTYVLYTHEEVDYFANYCVDNDEIYYVNIHQLDGQGEIKLRIRPYKNKRNTKNVRWAIDYQNIEM